MEATFESRCDWCQMTIYEGDDIEPDGGGNWMHAECAQEVAEDEDE